MDKKLFERLMISMDQMSHTLGIKKVSRFQGTLNRPNYFGNKDDRRYFVYVRIHQLSKDNPLNAPIYKGGYWHYTFKVNTYTDRMRNAKKAIKSRYVVLFPWK